LPALLEPGGVFSMKAEIGLRQKCGNFLRSFRGNPGISFSRRGGFLPVLRGIIGPRRCGYSVMYRPILLQRLFCWVFRSATGTLRLREISDMCKIGRVK
jgi:hypothetical protein